MQKEEVLHDWQYVILKSLHIGNRPLTVGEIISIAREQLHKSCDGEEKVIRRMAMRNYLEITKDNKFLIQPDGIAKIAEYEVQYTPKVNSGPIASLCCHECGTEEVSFLVLTDNDSILVYEDGVTDQNNESLKTLYPKLNIDRCLFQCYFCEEVTLATAQFKNGETYINPNVALQRLYELLP